MTLEEIAEDEKTAQDFIDFVMDTPEPEPEKATVIETVKGIIARALPDGWDRENIKRQDELPSLAPRNCSPPNP